MKQNIFVVHFFSAEANIITKVAIRVIGAYRFIDVACVTQEVW